MPLVERVDQHARFGQCQVGLDESPDRADAFVLRRHLLDVGLRNFGHLLASHRIDALNTGEDTDESP